MTTKEKTKAAPKKQDEEPPESTVISPGPSDDDESKDTGKEKATQLSPDLKKVRNAEDMDLREILEGVGTEGAWKVVLRRIAPEYVRDQQGKQVQTSGNLKTYTSKVDEDLIKREHGGGKYRLRFMKRNAAGSFVFFAERTMEIAGDPDLDSLPRSVPQVATPSADAGRQGDSPTLVTKAFDILTSQLDKAQQQQHPAPVIQDRGPDLATQTMLAILQKTIDQRDAQIMEMRQEIRELATQKPPEDPMKNKWIDKLMADDTARLTTVRTQYESEIRIIKQSHHDQEQRLQDRGERERTELKGIHERELGLQRTSHEVAMSAAKSSFEMQIKLLESENRRLERDNSELRSELKELRAKKDKSLVEQAREIQAVKEALGEDDTEQSTIDKIVGAVTNPAAIDFAKGIFGKATGTPAAAAAAAVKPVTKSKVVETPDGNKWLQKPDGSFHGPLRKPKKVVQGSADPTIPPIEQETLDRIIGILERSFAGQQDPEVVAQSARAHVPDEILSAIREHGVDGFLSKVAKLPGTSPLNRQDGRNWVRKVGKALIGE